MGGTNPVIQESDINDPITQAINLMEKAARVLATEGFPWSGSKLVVLWQNGKARFQGKHTSEFLAEAIGYSTDQQREEKLREAERKVNEAERIAEEAYDAYRDAVKEYTKLRKEAGL